MVDSEELFILPSVKLPYQELGVCFSFVYIRQKEKKKITCSPKSNFS